MFPLDLMTKLYFLTKNCHFSNFQFEENQIFRIFPLVIKFWIFYKKRHKNLIFEPFFKIQKPSLFNFSFYTIIYTRILIIVKIFLLN